MNDRISSPENPKQTNSRANLFFLLQTLAKHAQEQANQLKAGLALPITDEQIETYIRRNGTV